ncbi:MAG: response regulator, partial [Microvirga sp.]
MREALCELLVVLGLRCRSFGRAEALLAEIEPGLFDCVITDVKMPGMSGLDLLRRLRALDPALPVLVITSGLDPQTRIRALEDGALAYLTKPVEA